MQHVYAVISEESYHKVPAMRCRNLPQFLQQAGVKRSLDVAHDDPPIELRYLPSRGFGLFARRDLARGIDILHEHPLLHVKYHASVEPESVVLRQHIASLSTSAREALHALMPTPAHLSESLEARIFYNNCVGTAEDEGTSQIASHSRILIC